MRDIHKQLENIIVFKKDPAVIEKNRKRKLLFLLHRKPTRKITNHGSFYLKDRNYRASTIMRMDTKYKKSFIHNKRASLIKV